MGALIYSCFSSQQAKTGLPPQHAKIARAGDPGLAGSSCARISTPIREKRASWGPRACGARSDLSFALYGPTSSPHRAKNGLVGDPDFAALDSLRSSRANAQVVPVTCLGWLFDPWRRPLLYADPVRTHLLHKGSVAQKSGPVRSRLVRLTRCVFDFEFPLAETLPQPKVGYGYFDHLILLCVLIRRRTVQPHGCQPSVTLFVTYCFVRLLIPIDGLLFGLGHPHLFSGKMPSMPFPGSWQVKNGRLCLATTEVHPSSDWCSKPEIQAVAATIQRWFRRQQNRTQFDQ